MKMFLEPSWVSSNSSSLLFFRGENVKETTLFDFETGIYEEAAKPIEVVRSPSLDFIKTEDGVTVITCNTKDGLGRINKIRIYGSRKVRTKAVSVLLGIEDLRDLTESKAPLKIQEEMDRHHLNASILCSGNGVWSRTRILKNLKKIIKHGTLYDSERPSYIPVGSILRMPTVGDTILSKYFYQFLHLCCGSIAHYNIQGWISHYPTIEDLRSFFLKNERGKRVSDDIPWWKTDVKKIVRDIERLLGIRDTLFQQIPSPFF